MTTEYPIHPAADIFPMMTPEEYEGLKGDISLYGQHDWITLLEGKILDGRNRYKACLELGIEVECCDLDPEHCRDPVAYVLGKNLHRRQLSREQRNKLMLDLRALGRTCQEIATAVGSHKATVSRVVANATTEMPVTVQGKDGKVYPSKKKKSKRKYEPPRKLFWCKVCDEFSVAKDGGICTKCATAGRTAAPVDDDPCRVCQVGLRADGDRCQKCIDAGRTDPDVDDVPDVKPKTSMRNRLDEFIALWSECSDGTKREIRKYVASY